MNLQSFKGTPDSQKLRFKGSERKLPLGAPDAMKEQQLTTFCNESSRYSILLSRRDMLSSIADSVSSSVSIICRYVI